MSSHTACERNDAAALDRALGRMFRALEMRALPDRVRSVVDQLDEGETERLRKSG
jgi:hypothetical protein